MKGWLLQKLQQPIHMVKQQIGEGLMKKLRFIIMFLLMYSVCLAGCTSKSKDITEDGTETTTEKVTDHELIDSKEIYLKDMACNTLNGGAVTYDENRIYYVLGDILWSMNKDGSNQEKLYDKGIEKIWSHGDNVYFLHHKKLYTIDKISREEKLISDKEISTFFIVDDNLYYVVENSFYVSSLTDISASECIDDYAFLPITDGENIYYNCGRNINVISRDTLNVKFSIDNCSMNPYILGDYLYVSEEYDEAMDYKISIATDSDYENSKEECKIPSANVVQYDGYIYGTDGKMKMDTGKWTTYEENEVEQVYIAEDKLLYIVRNDNSNGNVMKMLDMDNETIVTVNKEENSETTDEHQMISEEEWQSQYYLDMAGNEFVTYDKDKVFYVLNGEVWSINKDGIEPRKLCDVNGRISGMWVCDMAIYIDKGTCVQVIDKETGVEQEIIYLAGESIIDVFAIVDKNIYFYVVRRGLYEANIDTGDTSPLVNEFLSSLLVTDSKHIFYQNDNTKQLYVGNMDGSECKPLNIEVEHWVHLIGNYLYIDSGNGYAYSRIPLDNPEKIESCRMLVNAVEYNGYIYSEYGKVNIETNRWMSIDSMEITDIDKAGDKIIYKVYDEEKDKHILKMLDMDDGTCVIIGEE